MNKLLVTAIVAATLGAAGCEKSRETATPVADSPPPAPQQPAPAAQDAGDRVDFSLTDMAGVQRHASEWDGQPKLINFWATWCAPCRREIPLLKETQDAHGDLDLQVIGIAVDFLEDVVAYAEQAEFNYPILVGQEDAMAVAETSGVEFIGLPFTMVVAPTGELLKTHVGEIVEAHIDAIVPVLAQLQSGEIDIRGAREALSGL